MKDKSDKQLMNLVKQGDPAAFEEIVLRHGNRIYHVALGVMKNDVDAQDVVQDVLVSMWQKASTWDENKSQLTTWMHRITVNRCYDILRKAQRMSQGEISEVEDERPSVLSHMEDAEEAMVLVSALGKLPEQQRLAISLTYIEGLKNKEVAECMGLTVKAVESLLVRARRFLSDETKEYREAV